MEEDDRFDEEDDDLQAAILVEPAKHDGNSTAKSRSLEEVIGPYLITDEPKVDIIVYQRQLLMSVERGHQGAWIFIYSGPEHNILR